ncbi:MAG: efflux RND transporter permease subunit [Hahellaceae bacterium]|nr:efflux RND transporter permease subunit [Hahellaceae bacterium]
MIAWFARHRVAANVMMGLIVILGLLALPGTRKELIPNVSLERVSVSVAFPGAAPESVETSVCTRIENAIAELESISDIIALASEGLCLVTADVIDGAETREVLEKIKTNVEGLSTLPSGAERPIIKELIVRNRVTKLIISGPADPRELKTLAEDIRRDLLRDDHITVIDLANVRPYEVAIEISDNALERYGLSFDEVVSAIRSSSVDIPGGSLRTRGGDILIQSSGKINRAADFENVILRADADGGRLYLRDVADIRDGFQRGDSQAQLNQMPAVSLDIFRVGEQNVMEVAKIVADYVAAPPRFIPEGVTLTLWQDDSKLFRSRIDLLLNNAMSGMVLVFLVLMLFLNWRLSFWVSLGIPVSFLGALWFLPLTGESINLISLFAFLLVLGIVVDDAIVVGESVYAQQRLGLSRTEAAVQGTREVAVPVIFALLTTAVAFLPLLFLPGPEGMLMKVIPIVVISTLIFSLVESLLILPMHLSGMPLENPRKQSRLTRWQSAFANWLEHFIKQVYEPFLAHVLVWRLSYLALFIGGFLISITLVGAGYIKVTLFSSMDADTVVADVTFAEGTPVAETRAAVYRIEKAAMDLQSQLRGTDGVSPIQNIYTVIAPQDKVSNLDVLPAPENKGRVSIEISPDAIESISSRELARRWQEAVGEIPGASELKFSGDMMAQKPDIHIELSGASLDALTASARELKEELTRFNGVYGIQDSQVPGKHQVKLTLKPVARDLGLTQQSLGRQINAAFYGVEVQSLQRGEDEVKVFLRYPEASAESLWHLETLQVQLPNGEFVPLFSVADVAQDAAVSTIKRYDRKRIVEVSAFVDSSRGDAQAIMKELKQHYLDPLAEQGKVQWSPAGKQKGIAEFMKLLSQGYLLALIGMYLLMAILFSSYSQPLLVMFAIPFGIMGALIGHLMLGIELTLWSLIGIVALSGVVVNDTLVLVDNINRRRNEGVDVFIAIREAGGARFRPIILTSLTTFAGLMPLVFETSIQAQFLIPMAVSLAFGVLFATAVSLLLVPAACYVLADLEALMHRFLHPIATRPDARQDTVEKAYQFGYSSGMDAPLGRTGKVPAGKNPYLDDVLASGWEAGWADGCDANRQRRFGTS